MKKKKIITVLMLLFLLDSGYAQNRTSSKLPAHIYGVWEIYKFVEVGGHAGEPKGQAEKQIGKRLKIERKSFHYEDNFLWFGSAPCKEVNYKIETRKHREYEVGDKGLLAFYGLEAAQENQSRFVVVACGKQRLCALELAKNKELAVYYDGWFFFLKKVGSA